MRTRFLAVFVLMLAVRGLPAQQPDGPYWTTVPIPAGFTSITNIGTTETIKATGSVTFWSAVLRTFTTVLVSASATVTSFNDYSMIRDGNTITAYCSRTGMASALTVSPGAVLTNGPTSSSWASVVVDGTQAWGYGAFRGQWAPLTLASASPQIAAGNNCLLIWDGTRLHALSSLTSTWTSMIPSEPVTGLSAGGFVGLAYGATTVFGFSNHKQHWTSYAFAAASAPVFRDNYGYISNSSADFLFYSAITETYAHYVPQGTTFLSSSQNVAAITDGNVIQLYASPTGVFVPVAVTSPGLLINSEWVIIDDGGALKAFSGVRGALAAPLAASLTGGNEDVAFATDVNGASYAYSAVLNSWTPAPAGVPNQVVYVRNGIIRAVPGGYDGFCARTGTWSSIATSPSSTFSTLNNSATFVTYDSGSMSVFDSRLGRWSTVATAATPALSIWRFTTVAHDGTTAYGFGMTSNVWETVALASAPVQFNANDSLGFVRTSTHLHLYSSLGSLTTVSRYPEFSRMQARGSQLRFMQIGPAGANVTVAVGTASGYLPVPGAGVAFIDVPSIWAFVDLGSIPGNGVLDLSFPLPDDPALNDTTFHLQDIITPLQGGLYITNSMSPIVL